MFQENKTNSPNYQIPSCEAIQQRKVFYTSTKFTDETVFEWYERVENVGNQCEFNRFHDFLILDKFVTGLDDGVLKRLSKEILLSLDEIFAIASLETQDSSLIGSETLVKSEDFEATEKKIHLQDEIVSEMLLIYKSIINSFMFSAFRIF